VQIIRRLPMDCEVKLCHSYFELNTCVDSADSLILYDHLTIC